MGRLPFLKQTLPTWLEQTTMDVLVVDYACPDGTAKWAREQGPRVSVTLGEPDRVTYAVARFNKARALNQALARAKELGHDELFLLDADTRVTGDLGGPVGEREMRIVFPAPGGRSLTGALGVRAHHLRAIGGFDEAMRGYGMEDLDVRARLYLAGLELGFFPEGRLEAIEHSDELRVEHYDEKDTARSGFRNYHRFEEKLTPEERARLLASPDRALIFAEAAAGP